MKNFPHQYNDFAKLRATLETIRDLNEQGADVGDEGELSHPIRILLRLVADNEIVERQGAELALEARDDTHAEYRRISALVGLPEAERITQLGTTEYQFANARKILPAFAEQGTLKHRTSQI